MKQIFIFIFTFSLALNTYANEYLIELQDKDIDSQIKVLKKLNVKFEKFASFIGESFERVYEVNANDKQIELIKKSLNPLLIERTVKVEKHSIESGKPNSNDFLSGYQYYLNYSGQKIHREISDIDSLEVNGSEITAINSIEVTKKASALKDKDVLVAVIDTGVDRHHPELKDSIFKNLSECDENGDVLASPEEDKDQNGLKGDCQGWDFAGNKRFAHIVKDNIGHGTHIAGIIGAKANDEGISGLAPNVKILPIQVFHPESRSPFTFISTVTKAILYAVKMKADIINLSLGWPYTLTPKTFHRALSLAKRNGVTIISSSGNDSNNQFIAPCAIQGVICVGATGIDGKKAKFSNYGLHVDLMAPGEEILSTFPTQSTPQQFSLNGYDILSGTSQSTPLITGSFALLKSLHPKATNDEILARLMLSSKNKSEISQSASGIIKLDRANEMKEASVIRPIVKDFQEILISKNGSFKFNLRFKNYWKTSKKAQIQITSTHTGVSFKESQFEFETIKRGEVKNINLSGLVKDFNMTNELIIKISVKTEDNNFEREHRVELLSILTNQEIMKSSRSLELSANAVLFYKGPELLSRMRTIPNFLDDSNEKAYWLPKNDGIIFISKKENIFKPIPLEVKEFSRVLSLEERDFNFDSKNDYLLRYVSNTEPQYIGYLYFDNEGKQIESFKYFPEASVYSLGSGQYISHETVNGKIALPVWVAKGVLPKADINPDPWVSSNQAKIKKNRIYYLEIAKDNELRVRVIDNESFLENLRDDFKLQENQHIEIRQVQAQNQSEYLASSLNFIIGTEDNNQKWQSFKLSFEGLNLIEKSPLDLKAYQFFGNMSSKFILEGSKFQNLIQLVSSQSDQIMITTDIESASDDILKANGFNETLLSNLANYNDSKGSIQVVETENNISFYRKIGDLYEFQDKISLNRVSFFGNSAFRSSFVPMVHSIGEETIPAIYQDSTFLGNRKVALIEYNNDENKVVSTIKKSFKIPSYCSTLNPIQNNNKIDFHMICDMNGKLRVLRKSF